MIAAEDFELKADVAADVSQRKIIFLCPCGSHRQASLSHYQTARCGNCGLIYWALQPKRKGPLVAVVWPGLSTLNSNPSQLP